MTKIINQGLVLDQTVPIWKNLFSNREYVYLKNVINELIKRGESQELWIQYGEKDNLRALHIIEPFTILNYIGYTSPSVVSIAFTKENNKILFFTGDDNGLCIFSNNLSLDISRDFPRNSTADIDFWHFVDAIGNSATF